MLTKKQLVGKTTEEAIKKIRDFEKSNIFAYEIISLKIITKNYFKCFKNHHLYNKDHKRIYYIRTNTYVKFAKNQSLEKNKKVIDLIMEKSQHSFISLNGNTSPNYTHNVYYLVINDIEPKNHKEGYKKLWKSTKQEFEYKENELTKKQRRFTL